MDVLQNSQMAKSLLKKAVQVDVLQNREQVRVWRIHTASSNCFALKWMPEWRLRTSREQVRRETPGIIRRCKTSVVLAGTTELHASLVEVDACK